MNRRRSGFVAALLPLSLIAAAPTNALADEPARGEFTCIALLLLDAVPAQVEWSYWVSGGGGWTVGPQTNGLRVLGLGMEATTQLAKLTTSQRYGGAFELQGGPWWGMTTDLQGVRAEGGYVLSLGQESHAQWGTYALRIGGGLGDDSLGLSPHFVATLTGGIRFAGDRYSERGACDPKPKPKPTGLAESVRLFATARTTFADGAPWQLTFGVEFTPSFFLPPYGLGKWIGARP